MSEKITKQMNADVPEMLANTLDYYVEKLGIKKKRAIAAAIHMFCKADTGAQYAAYQEVHNAFYAGDDPELEPIKASMTAKVGREREAAKQAQTKKKQAEEKKGG